MIRIFAMQIALLLPPVTAAAEVAPAPRRAGEATSVDVAKRVERIIRNAGTVGDRLAKLDPGRATRLTQGDILQDIEALIREQESPPPPKSGDSPMPKSGDPPMPKSGDLPPRSSPGLPSDSKDPPTPLPHRPQRNRMQPEPKPMPESIAKPGSEKKPTATTAAAGTPTSAKPLLPLTGDVEKAVWGHLPEQLRQQVSNYYRQEFMPQYAELLRQYYASLAERDGKR